MEVETINVCLAIMQLGFSEIGGRENGVTVNRAQNFQLNRKNVVMNQLD